METPDEGRVLIVGNLWSACGQLQITSASVGLCKRRSWIFCAAAAASDAALRVWEGQAFLLGVGAVSLPRLCIDPWGLVFWWYVHVIP